MRSIKLFFVLATLVAYSSCTTVQVGNTTATASVFSLKGKWKLTYSTTDNGLMNSIVTVPSILSQGKLTTLVNNTQCYRQNDIKWKNIKSDKNGGFTMDNLLANCSSGSLNYEPATIAVVNNNEIKVDGKDVAGANCEQTWSREK